MNDMTYEELKSIKSNIITFISKLNEISIEFNQELNQSEKAFFIFISKHIILFKYLYEGMGKMYFFKVIISDLYYYILSIIKNETRYIYLNERSIIENYTRAVVRKTVEEDHVTENLFTKIKNMEFSFDFKEEDYALIKSEYVTSCGFVHGSSILEGDLAFILDECLENSKFIKDINKYYERIRKIFKTYDKMLISQYGDIISSCFHRQKTIFEYLLGEECLDLLLKVTTK
jgi:hypothetical protein